MEQEPLIRPNMPELDFVRGIAILGVLLGHAFFWVVSNSNNLDKIHGLEKFFILLTRPGWLGIQLFFILSGFLITGILLDTRERPDYFRRFYTRRALRILPAYLMLILILLLSKFIQAPFLLVSLFFISNFSSLLGIPMQYGPLWILAVEGQFYLFWPQFVRRLSRKSLAIVLSATIILVPIIRLLAFIHNPQIDVYYYTWFVVDALAMGALLSLFLRSAYATRKKTVWMGIGLFLSGVTILIIGMPFGILSRSNILGATLQIFPWNILFTGFIATCLILGTSRWKRFVNIKWLRYFGRISYGLYLIHLFIFYKFDEIFFNNYLPLYTYFRTTFSGLSIRFVVAGGFSIIIAILSREYFEEFFLRLKNKFFAKNEQ